MQKTFSFFKQFVVLFVFSLISLAVYAQDTKTSEEKPQGLIFGGGQITNPQYEGGPEAMFKFIEDNLVYPESAQTDNVSGRVILQARIDADGNVKDVSVKQGLTPDCNYAAIKVIEAMPLWRPAMQNGKKINGFVTIPVVFKTKQIVYEYTQSEEELDYDQYQLMGKKWILVEISGKELPDNLPTVPYFTLTQNDKKRKILDGNASCADFTGMYSWTPKNWGLKFTVKEVTKKKCKSKKVKVIDGEFLALLKSASQYRVKDGQLTIGKMVKERFTPVAVFEYELIKEKGKKK